MPDLTYGDYLNLNENKEIPKDQHTLFINKQEPVITITSPMRLLEERLETLTFF